MADRPYQYHSEAQLLEHKRDIERNMRSAQRDADNFVKRFSSRPGDYTWVYDDREYKGIVTQVNDYNKDLSAVKAELNVRNEQRRREPEGGPRRTNQDLIMVECGCRPPRRIKLRSGALDRGPIFCGICDHDFIRS
jgi:hypothetical protein